MKKSSIKIKGQNAILHRGINCPLCGKLLVDLLHNKSSVYTSSSNIHEFWCDECAITIDVTVDHIT